MAKMDKKWVVLCSAAITAVYAAGYHLTDPSLTDAAIPASAQSHVQSGSAAGSLTIDSTASIPAPADKPAAAAPKRVYQDGTFTGLGMNRRGSIEVTIKISKDKITDVVISNYGMHYSMSDVADLPAEVIQQQNTSLTNVSGATYSTEAFTDAVNDALAKARNA
ncbi:FMN-binding protein [Paenibacillus sp. JX-17]|uniref:FMN-binding protein n=1 Tax=Paenibacillus lacisoli TaxID=3064525 RepID=A0ABT9CAK8_9BACL|nr:FMN-binding protein [Paenibacillus sp. JX-17]MDO7906277.1 FMN-binding protein [Paenibacillus sp. JX-17]